MAEMGHQLVWMGGSPSGLLMCLPVLSSFCTQQSYCSDEDTDTGMVALPEPQFNQFAFHIGLSRFNLVIWQIIPMEIGPHT